MTSNVRAAISLNGNVYTRDEIPKGHPCYQLIGGKMQDDGSITGITICFVDNNVGHANKKVRVVVASGITILPAEQGYMLSETDGHDGITRFSVFKRKSSQQKLASNEKLRGRLPLIIKGLRKLPRGGNYARQ